MEVVRSHSSSKPKSSQPKSLLSDFNPLNAELINSINIHDPRPVPLMQSTYNNNGTLFACVGSTPLIYLIKTNQPTKYTVLQGHEGFVRGVAWSHGNTRLLSASVDKTVHLWSPSNPTHHQYQSVMTLSHTLHNFKHKPDDNNVRFGSEISHVSFYYIDKFILLCSANILYMYKYYIDPSSPDDIRRYQTRNYYKKVTSLSQPSSHAITALSTINDFHSYIVLSAGSNRSLTAYDMNIGREVWQKEQAHSRYIHCITQNKGTRYRSLTSDAYDLFATSSISDGIKLWDLRTQRYVRWYTSYANRSQPIMASFSPCGRYIATGSEDNSAVVYDIRYIEPLVKLSCSSNVVSSVSFNPVSSEVSW
jgi:WD40 repeat protein